jgi:hypothetical protein
VLASCVVYATQERPDSGPYRSPIAIQFLWAVVLGGGLFVIQARVCYNPFCSIENRVRRIRGKLEYEGLSQKLWNCAREGTLKL